MSRTVVHGWTVQARVVAAAVVVWAVGGGGHGAAGQKAVSEPRAYVRVRTVDVGRLRQGEKGTARWTLENHGSADLHITEVHGSCSCTVLRKLSEEDRVLEPGESLQIEAVFDTTGRRGSQRRSVTIVSDDPDEPQLKLFLTADVVTLMEISVKGRPARAFSLGSVRPGTTVPEPIEVLPTDPGQKLEITQVELGDDALRFDPEPLHKDDRQGAALRLRVRRGSRIGRRVATTLTIRATVGGQPTQGRLRINGEIVGDLSYRPLVIKQWDPIPHGSALKTVHIRSETKEPFEILKAEAGPVFDVTVSNQHDGLEYSVVLRVSDRAPAGPAGTFLDIQTSLVSQPLIRIPVFVDVRPWVEADPAIVLLRVGDGDGASSSRLVKLETADRTPLNIGDVDTERGLVKATVSNMTVKSRAVKYIEVSAGRSAGPGSHQDVVRIKTNVARQPEVRIPVRVIVH